MLVGRRLSASFALLLILGGCAVSDAQVPGTYTVSYPFGTETLTLTQDGIFIQEVRLVDEAPVTVNGTWKFDAKESRITFTGMMIVVDSLGLRRSSWKTVAKGLVVSNVVKHPSGIQIGSGGQYPFLKK